MVASTESQYEFGLPAKMHTLRLDAILAVLMPTIPMHDRQGKINARFVQRACSMQQLDPFDSPHTTKPP